MSKHVRYEQEKARIARLNLSSEAYTKAIQALAKRLKI